MANCRRTISKKMTNDIFALNVVQKEKLMKWFGQEIKYCKQYLEEIGNDKIPKKPKQEKV